MKHNIPIAEIKKDSLLRSDFISQYTNFILSSSSKAVGRYITEESDEFPTALSAFDEAIEKYDESKGDFFAFAFRVIKSRLIDDFRRNKANPLTFSDLAKQDSDGHIEELEIIGRHDVVDDISLELAALKTELKEHDISLFDLPHCSPKAAKTKHAVAEVLDFITADADARKAVLKNNTLPVQQLLDSLPIRKKLLERHRKYIIACVIILSGDYPITAQYIKNLKGGVL